MTTGTADEAPDMPFSTTIAGSLPKPSWLAEPERIFPNWRLDGAELAAAQRDATRIAVAEQLRAGIDTVTDGEQSRRHFVHGFAERLGGVDATKRRQRGIRDDRYQAICPTSPARSAGRIRSISTRCASRER